MGLGNKFKEVKKAYVEANKLLGDLIKVRRGGGAGEEHRQQKTSVCSQTACSPLPTFLPFHSSASACCRLRN